MRFFQQRTVKPEEPPTPLSWVLLYPYTAWNIAGGQNGKTEVLLLQAHHEEAEFFGKHDNVGETEGNRKRGGANVT